MAKADWIGETLGTLPVDGVRTAPMHPLTRSGPQSPRLAAAFLALSDVDPAPGTETRTAPMAVVAAVLATVLLAFSAPLAWMSRPALRPSDQPAATQASKAPAVPGLDDDGAGAG